MKAAIASDCCKCAMPGRFLQSTYSSLSHCTLITKSRLKYHTNPRLFYLDITAHGLRSLRKRNDRRNRYRSIDRSGVPKVFVPLSFGRSARARCGKNSPKSHKSYHTQLINWPLCLYRRSKLGHWCHTQSVSCSAMLSEEWWWGGRWFSNH